jgi:hypothetical protein
MPSFWRPCWPPGSPHGPGSRPSDIRAGPSSAPHASLTRQKADLLAYVSPVEEWASRLGPDAGIRGPVTVEAAAPTDDATAVPSAVLISRQGLRVEGLDRDTLIAILRALG